MLQLFAIPIFIASVLIFLIQPLIGKLLLPTFGSSAAVWNSCMLFFQISLLLGYSYANILNKYCSFNKQIIIHLSLFFIALIYSFYFLYYSTTSVNSIYILGAINNLSIIPELKILLFLSSTLALPMLIVTSTSPLIQSWYSHTNFENSHNPYPLYAISNFANILGLLGYIIILEPWLKINAQLGFWQYSLILLFISIAMCCYLSFKNYDTNNVTSDYRELHNPKPQKTIYWLGLSIIPASLLLSLTQLISVNINPMPMVWVLPLTLYLLSFAIGFSRRKNKLLRKLPHSLVYSVPILLLISLQSPQLWVIIPHVLLFFVLAICCHHKLYLTRPNARHLTFFYLVIGLGGIIGSSINTFIAPLVFNNYYEYPIMIALGILLINVTYLKNQTMRRLDFKSSIFYTAIIAAILMAYNFDVIKVNVLKTILIFYGFVIVALFYHTRRLAFSINLLIISLSIMYIQYYGNGKVLYASRNFYGIQKVTLTQNTKKLVSGNTSHGAQFVNGNVAYSYYRPLEDVLKNIKNPLRIAAIGLGSGTTACMRKKEDVIDFIDINPEMIKIAKTPSLFTYLQKCSYDNLSIILGDGRLKIAEARDGMYDAIVLDAYTSDSIPVHLTTLEATQTYLNKMKPDGMLLFHISNRHLNLKPVLKAIADKLGLNSYRFRSNRQTRRKAGEFTSEWVMLTKQDVSIEQFNLPEDISKQWSKLYTSKTVLWTDDYSNLISIMK